MSLRPLIDRLSDLDLDPPSSLPDGLLLSRSREPRGFDAVLYEPLVCLILQGSKEVRIGERAHRVGPGECIVVSHAVPVTTRVLEASPERPYLSLVAPLDLALLRSLDHDLGDDPGSAASAGAFAVHAVDDATVAVLRRFVALLDDPTDARVLGPAVRRELHYRLLRAPSGAMLRSLLQRGSHASHIAQAIAALRRDFRQRLEVDALARSVGMSPSSFYRHFKDVTATTPLQYHKRLRLTEARRLLRGGEHSVATAAFEVGYESPSQFSREYARTFGAPPRTELAASA